MDEVTIKVPATTANLGPGYDCLGIALQLYNRVTVKKARISTPHEMTGEVSDVFFAKSGQRPFKFQWNAEGEVPRSRGLGSSVTVRLGLLYGLNELSGRPLKKDALFQLCAQLEGHPDNAAPAAFGGFTVAQNHTGTPSCIHFPVSEKLAFVLLIPDFEVSTPAARKALPKTLPHKDASMSCANTAGITAAFASQNYALLKDRFHDGLHQPYRLPLVPFLDKVIKAGENAGALGGFLSGSGSTIACVTLKSPEKIGEAMQKAAGDIGCSIIITAADNKGVRKV